MVAQTDPHAVRAEGPGLSAPQINASPDERMRGCPPAERATHSKPLALGLAIGAMLWLAIGLFSWQFFR